MKKFIFFTVRDFEKEVGENVRIYGLINTLAALGHEVLLISNTEKFDSFHKDVVHISVGCNFNEKRSLQALTSILPANIVRSRYREFFNKIDIAISKSNPGNLPVIFFDYLDNSIGYLLKKSGKIKHYINDIHGIATIEFKSNISNSQNLKQKLLNEIKYQSAKLLDKKVFSAASGFIFGSFEMLRYYSALYPIENKKKLVIPYVLGSDAEMRKINPVLKEEVKKNLVIEEQDFVYMFVGSYKPTAGVQDLILAFDKLYKEKDNIKLILIGGGPTFIECRKLAATLNSVSKIIFIDKIRYEELITYQSVANVLVCPDRNNPFSQAVIHVKYFDALLSGKIVINGAFKSVLEVNPNENISLLFQPSDIESLYKKMKESMEYYSQLSARYRGVREFTINKLTYKNYLDDLVNLKI